MIEAAVILHSHYAWASLCGVFLGLAGAQLTILPSRFENPVKVRRRRPTKIFFALSAAVASATAGLFLSESEGLLDPGLLWILGVAFVLGGLGFRFKRFAGLPVLTAAAAIVFLSQYLFNSWVPLSPDSKLCMLKILRLTGRELTASVSRTGSAETILDFAGDGLVISVWHLSLAKPYEMLGRRNSFRNIAISDSSGSDSRMISGGSFGFLDEFFYAHAPGIDRTEKRVILKNLKLYSSYSLSFDEDENLTVTVE